MYPIKPITRNPTPMARQSWMYSAFVGFVHRLRNCKLARTELGELPCVLAQQLVSAVR